MKQQGFTLIELLISMVIVLILANYSISATRDLLLHTQAKSDISELLLQVRTARHYAIINSQHTVLCPSYNTLTCVNDWKAAKVLFLDINNNKKRDMNEPIERQFNSLLNPSIKIRYPKSQIRFNEQGITHFFNGTLSYCLDNIIYGLVISRLGRIRIAYDLDGDNIPDVNRNKTVSCN